MYHVPEGIDTLVFSIKDGQLVIKSYVTSGPNTFDESEIVDDPTRHINGTNFEIDDSRFEIVNHFAKYGYSVFQRYRNNDESVEEDRCILAVNYNDVQES